MKISDDDLHGRVVLSADGIALGEVTKLFLQGSQFAIDGLRIRLRKDIAERLGIERSVFKPATLDIPAASVQSVGDAVLLSIKFDELRALRTTSNEHTQRDTKPAPIPDQPLART